MDKEHILIRVVLNMLDKASKIRNMGTVFIPGLIKIPVKVFGRMDKLLGKEK